MDELIEKIEASDQKATAWKMLTKESRERIFDVLSEECQLNVVKSTEECPACAVRKAAERALLPTIGASTITE